MTGPVADEHEAAVRQLHAAWRALHSYFLDAIVAQPEAIGGPILARLGGAQFEFFARGLQAGDFLRVIGGVDEEGRANLRVEVLTDVDGWRPLTIVLPQAIGVDQAEAEQTLDEAWQRRARRELDLDGDE